MIRRRSRYLTAALLLAGLCLHDRVLRSDSPPIPRFSTIAPAADLIQQVDFFANRLTQSLADLAGFEGANQSRAIKDSNTLTALSLVLAKHDEDHGLKTAAPAMLQAAREMVAAEGDFARLKASFSRFEGARAEPADGIAEPEWEKVASLGALMKQVPLVHDRLKRGLEPSRFSRQVSQSAGQSATLAAIAQASMFNTELATNPAALAQWNGFCAQMRTAAGEVNSAVHRADAADAAAGMRRLSQSCDACHAVFRRHAP